ncbi:putative ribonuclease H-like domain-containing protein [Tanacetum coccineum]|uniref:Ribonuclease H-like domain-containing protein n=1 Tax=Tanacetum coccineum TaxID=301880 RepID=A0ABQ4ZVP6_9ASTR
MVLVDMTGVIRQRKGLIMYSWLTRLLSSDSEVSNDSNCSKSCMETVKLLGSQNDQLLRDLEKSSLMVLGYKTGLESVEEKLEFYKKNEPVYVANINGLKWDIQVREITISELNEFVNKPVVENRKSDEEVSKGNPQMDLQDKGVIDSGCSRHMTRNMSYLTNYEEIDGGYVAFGGNPKGGKIIRKLIDESQVLLRVPRKNNMYSVDLKNIVPKRGLTFLFAKATSDESKLWHRRLGHLNFKTMNKLVKGNLVRGLPSKLFKNDQTCVACQKGKQHKASCKTKIENSISLPLHLLHMDLFGPTFVKILMKKMYCLVVTDDYSRFIWVFFLATKDETSGILKSFITGIENLVDHKVKVIRCDNGTEFKNREMNQFCEMKGILRQFSIARTPQQNGVAERRKRTLIKVARTMLADSKLPTTFWAEAINTTCYVQNRVLVVKPHNKTPYELFHGRTPTLSFMRPFGYPGIKSFLMLFGITTVLIDVNAAQSKLVLLENFNENYSKCLRLLVKLQLSVQSYYC